MEIIKKTLPNGMAVLLEADNAYPVVAIQLWVKIGSIHETDEQAGISHFVEHLLFKGTPSKTSLDISRMIGGRGGEINAYTTFEQTAYHVVIASRHWEKALEVIADMVQNSRFPEEGIENERKVILEEIKEGEDTPEVVLAQTMFSDAYRVENYRRPVIGYRKTVESLTREDLFSHFKKYYVPSNMVLTVAGSFELGEMIAKVEELFSGSVFTSVKGKYILHEPPQNSLRYSAIQKGQSENIIEIAFHIPGGFHSDVPALDLLSIILGEGDGSRLNQELVFEKGLARDAGAFTFTPAGSGLFMARATPFNGKFKETLSQLLYQFWKVLDVDVSDGEIARARATIEKEILFQEETVYGKGKKLAYYESTFGDHFFERHYLQAMRKVRKSDIREAAKRYLKSENLTVTVLFPEGEGHVASLEEIEKIVLDSKKGLKKGFSAEPQKIKRKSVPLVKKTMLRNGVTLLTKRNKLSPMVSVVTITPGGVRSETTNDNGISGLIANLIQKGTKKRNYKKIADDITMMGGYVESFVGKNSFGFKMDVIGKNLKKALELYFDLLLNSIFPEDYLKNEKKRALEELSTLKDNFEAYGYYEFLKGLYGNHPYGLNSIGSESSIKGITRKKVLKRYKRMLDPKNLVISVVGSFEEKGILRIIKGKLEKLRRFEENDFKSIEPFKLEKSTEIRKKIKSNNAYIHFGFRGTKISDNDKYPLEIINSALSNFGDGRLYAHLRENLALAYSVFSIIFHGIDDGYLIMYLNTDPKNLDLAVTELKNVLKDLRENGLSDEELERVKNYLVGSYDIELQKNSNQALTLALNELYSLPLDFEVYSREIMKVDKERVNEAIRKYLDPEKYVQIILAP